MIRNCCRVRICTRTNCKMQLRAHGSFNDQLAVINTNRLICVQLAGTDRQECKCNNTMKRSNGMRCIEN